MLAIGTASAHYGECMNSSHFIAKTFKAGLRSRWMFCMGQSVGPCSRHIIRLMFPRMVCINVPFPDLYGSRWTMMTCKFAPTNPKGSSGLWGGGWCCFFQPPDSKTNTLPFLFANNLLVVDWQGGWICTTRDQTAGGAALCWTYKSRARRSQVSKRVAHNYQKFLHHCRRVSSHSSLYIYLHTFFSASDLLSVRTRAIQFLFISPSPLLELSHPRRKNTFSLAPLPILSAPHLSASPSAAITTPLPPLPS